jgi:hypothetical protein
MSKNLRISLIGFAGAIAGFVLQGCFAAQPTPECSVTITAAGLGLPPYYVKLDRVSGTGSCSQLDHMYAGVQRFRTQASGGAFTFAIRSSPVVDPYLGYVYSADVDPYNNCANEENCTGEDDEPGDVSGQCVTTLGDGGVETYDGTPVSGDEAQPTDGGEPFTIDTENECISVDDPITRADPADQNGKLLNAIGKMPQFPTNDVCAVTDFVGGEQNFQEEVLDLVDGTTTTLPAITYKLEYSNFNIINSAKVQGTAFVSDVKYTEGSCVAEYKAVGFWPEIHCSNDPSEGALVDSTECDPNADLDAGRVFGSGINPEFKPKCDTALGVCVPSVDVTTIK